MSERKFIQPVAMPVNKEQYLSISSDLLSIGYVPYSSIDEFVDEYYFLSNTWGNNANNYYFIVQEYSKDKPSEPSGFYNGAIFIDYNPELFLALAAMSEGDEFYPGEWLACIDPAGKSLIEGDIYQCHRTGAGGFVFLNVDPNNDGWDITRFRKATAEELIVHFAPKSMADPEKELIPVFKEYDTKTEPYGAWTPAFGELCQFHSDHSPEREKRFFLGINSAGKYIATDANPNEIDVAETGRVSVHDYCEKFGAPVNIPLKEVQEVFAGIYNVLPEQIKIV